MSHTAPTVAMKALPSSKEEFQVSLMSKTWKYTGIKGLPICTSRFLMNPPEFLSEQSIKVNESSEGSIFRPRWSAITLGSLFFLSVILCPIFSLTWWNILLMSSSASLVSLKNIHSLWVECLGTFSFLFLKVEMGFWQHSVVQHLSWVVVLGSREGFGWMWVSSYELVMGHDSDHLS
ncbi:hypothetical protein DY000_02007761 [Brassica cretica]|uniref:Uncharacterized protein n=1 Tax=Brassica cretica TaxID=69181 RepID=A0ABQ7C096_BRACR|nr:hypothetical protein DY000_02007761 [Brassica cretica]